MERCHELKTAHERARRDLLHAEESLNSEIAARLRRQQAVALSVLRKLNGKEVPLRPEPGFHRGCAAWAVALQEGFEVVALENERVIVRALCLPESQQKPVTYTLPLALLTRSDRDFASKIRGAVAKEKVEAKAYRQWEAKREAREVSREVRSTRRKLEVLQAREENLLREAQA